MSPGADRAVGGDRAAGAFAAVDLGASSGRVILGRVGPGVLELVEAHRFENEPVRVTDGLHWDILRLHHEVLAGLRRAAAEAPDLVSVGIDSWGVDYALLDARGALVANPHHYRDERTNGVPDRVHARLPVERLYERTGIQVMQINTIYQLAAAAAAGELAPAERLLQIPDLLGYWLSDVPASEATMASTTALLDVRTGDWADDVIEAAGIPRRLFGALRQPGDVVGPLSDAVRRETGLPPSTVLTLVGSHDTASSVVGVPAEDERFAYVSCGTWGLVGVELEHPVVTPASRAANFTNEGGVDGRIRFLRNVMGLWLLQESVRAWKRAGLPSELGPLLAAAAEVPAGGPMIDPDDPAFLPPGDMPARIAEACARAGQPVPEGQAAIVRCILDSLAAAFARALDDAVRLSGHEVRDVHLVGGGARNELLCQLTADACGLPVLAGPVESTALGNVLVQARAHGAVRGDLATLRGLVRATHPVRRYEPRPGAAPRATRAVTASRVGRT
ncbi:MAG TPA: rhamnulokinase family protein [Candidatus Limnocylindrales bacterium]|nr:rhamnulokinase family protein [Candidatus Limnocylindrales bacterium]